MAMAVAVVVVMVSRFASSFSFGRHRTAAATACLQMEQIDWMNTFRIGTWEQQEAKFRAAIMNVNKIRLTGLHARGEPQSRKIEILSESESQSSSAAAVADWFWSQLGRTWRKCCSFAALEIMKLSLDIQLASLPACLSVKQTKSEKMGWQQLNTRPGWMDVRASEKNTFQLLFAKPPSHQASSRSLKKSERRWSYLIAFLRLLLLLLSILYVSQLLSCHLSSSLLFWRLPTPHQTIPTDSRSD